LKEKIAMQFDERFNKWKINDRLLYILVFTVLSISLLLRLMFASMAHHPGHGDYAFYYTVAENIVDGKGFQIDYIWNYLSSPESISHSSNDYWMPLTSVIISLPLFVFGKSLSVGLLPSILAGLALSVLTYFSSKIYSNSRFVAFCSSGLILVVPSLFKHSLLTDSTVFYALFVSSALFFMMKGWTNPKFFLLSSALIALAHLTRQDGLLLIPVLIGMILLSRQQQIKTKLIYVSLALGLYFLILFPLMAANYGTFGLPLPPGPFKTMFLTQYEDLYSYQRELSLHSYLEWGFLNIFLSKARITLSNTKILFNLLGGFLGIMAVVGVFNLVAYSGRRQRWKGYYLLPLLFLGILFVFYTLIAPFPGEKGGFVRSSMAITPFLVVIAVDATNRTFSSKAAVGLSVLLVAALFSYQSISSTKSTINSNTYRDEQFATLKKIVADDARKQGYGEIVIMTRIPWEVYYSTRYKAIQIPNENLEIIYKVAQKYGANYLLLPAPREVLEPLYVGKVHDDRFQSVSNIPNSNKKLFRIILETMKPNEP
jgi:4-amino-4-deoxy-L-arabinose transferase-like glycosyltransferase